MKQKKTEKNPTAYQLLILLFFNTHVSVFYSVIIKFFKKFKNLKMSTFQPLIAIFSISLSIIGIIGNVISMIVCLRKDLRRTPTFIFKIFINILNIIPIITIVLYPFATYIFEIELNSHYFRFGKTMLFLALWSSQASTYLTVIFRIFNLFILI
jgi:hypothetical protein